VRWAAALLVLAAVAGSATAQGYFGKKLGSLKQLEHGVSGDIYAVDSRTIHIRNFNYDGQGPDAYFFVGSGTQVYGQDKRQVPDENGRVDPLGPYRNKDITLTLPSGVTLDKVQWMSVWCRKFAVDFGNLVLQRPVANYPRPQRIGRLQGIEHDVASGDIVVVDAQTLLIPDFTYDGSAPDAHFWVGKGRKPSPDGITVADENGSKKPLRKYARKTVVVTLPGDTTVFDIDYISIWCEDFFADFGHVRVDKQSLNVPPSLKMLGVKPQTKLNCEVLDSASSLEVRWAVAGESIVMQLVSNLADGEYMAFGLSGDSQSSVMVGGDVVVAWLEHETGRGFAHDYYLQQKAQCAGGKGSCPDNKIRGGKNSVRLLNAALINGFSMLTFQRPLSASDRMDQPIYTNGSQPVIWAVGPVNSAGDTSYHTKRSRGDLFIDFGRTPTWNCAVAGSSSSSASRRPSAAPARRPSTDKPWTIPAVKCSEPEDGVFYAQIGPTGGKRGYNAITSRVGWGIAWYINGLLIPEINVVRGKTYTFVVEGGLDPALSAKYHPFYITDDPEGGYEFKSEAERAAVSVYAGVTLDSQGRAEPTATGRLCSWKEDPDKPADNYGSFGSYQRTLQLDCEEGQPGILQWTPDENTPDTVYYQCFTHRYLGWKINVVDSCGSGAGSRRGSTRNSGGRVEQNEGRRGSRFQLRRN